MSQVPLSASARSIATALPTNLRNGQSLTEIADLLNQALKVNEQLERRLELLTEEVARYKNVTAGGGSGRVQAEMNARERLLRDELERKVQALQVELKQERSRTAERILQMEMQLSNCLCRGSR